MALRLLAGGVDASLEGAGLPYGYTVTIWGSGQIMIDQLGKPGVAAVFGVVLGAATAFGALKMGALGVQSTVAPTRLASDHHVLRTGVIHVAAITAAVGAVALVALIGSGVVWPLGGFTATIVYLTGTSVAMALYERDERASDASSSPG